MNKYMVFYGKYHGNSIHIKNDETSFLSVVKYRPYFTDWSMDKYLWHTEMSSIHHRVCADIL